MHKSSTSQPALSFGQGLFLLMLPFWFLSSLAAFAVSIVLEAPTWYCWLIMGVSTWVLAALEIVTGCAIVSQGRQSAVQLHRGGEYWFSVITHIFGGAFLLGLFVYAERPWLWFAPPG